MKQEVVFELPGEFNRKICVGFWGDKAHDAGTLREGDKVAVSINVESPELPTCRLLRRKARPTPASRPMTCLSETAFRELSVGHSQQDR